MLYLNSIISNYEDFKNLFGIVEHGNGVKSRRNKILLSLYKSKEILKHVNRTSRDYNLYTDFYSCTDMTSLYNNVMTWLHKHGNYNNNALNKVWLMNNCFWCVKYFTDEAAGICEDGDARCIRYINSETGRVYKMKTGKFLREIIKENNTLNSLLPEPVKNWVCEEFSEKWKAYAEGEIRKHTYTLHVNDNFEGIYNSCICQGDFGSCMTDEGYWTFYRDCVKAKAAYLTNADDMIVARCIIYTDVFDSNGKKYRLAERQYATDKSDTLKRILVNKLIAGGYIDGYKRVGADCHSPRAFVDNNDKKIENDLFYIECDIHRDSVISYQDTFKFWKVGDKKIWNDGDCETLSVTNGEPEMGVWSEFNQEYIPEYDACYVETRGDNFYDSQVVSAFVLYPSWNYYYESCYEGDCVAVGKEYYYAGYDGEDLERYGIHRCDECGEFYIEDRENAYYSKLLERWFCCEYCARKAEKRYAEENSNILYDFFDEEYFDSDFEDCVRVLKYSNLYRKRVNSITRRKNIHEFPNCFVLYKGNWYYENLAYSPLSKTYIPCEKFIENVAV